MKGIVFNLLEEVVSREHGAEMWDDMLDAAHTAGIYTSLGNYPDEDLYALVAVAAARLGQPANDVLRWFGCMAMPILSDRYPALFANHNASRSFILSVNSIIHPEVRKLYAGASYPSFHFREGDDGSLVMTYESVRKLCFLAHGFIEGAAGIYRESVEVSHRTCMHDGDSACTLEIKWTR